MPSAVPLRVWIAASVLAVFSTTGTAKSPVPDLVVAVPMAEAAQSKPDHFYRPGFEAEVARQACALIRVRCNVKASSVYPSERDFGVPGAHVALYGSGLSAGQSEAATRFAEAVHHLAEDGKLWALKRRYLLASKPWPGRLRVGVEPETHHRAQRLCTALRADCEFVVASQFSELARQFDAGTLQLVVHSQSRLFVSGALEDRLVLAETAQ